MPKIAFYKYLTFFIVSFDTLREPPHLHIARERGKRTYSAKIWLNTLEFSDKGSLSNEELTLVRKLVSKYQPELLSLFEKAKNGKRFEPLKLDL
jgi:hypothetical protein